MPAPAGDEGLSNGRFLRACRRQPVDRTPVWFMRQAGRYMAEYRALRQKYTLLQLCRAPDLATQVTLQPVQRIEVDAAILFSDLLLPLEPLGIPFDFIQNEGPSIERPVRSAADIDRLRRFEPREALGYVLEAIKQITRELPGRMPLIGFAGAPFTLASYAIEGGPSKDFARTKALMYADPAAWHRFARHARDRGRRLPGGADRGRCRRRAGVRFVGRRAPCRRLSRVRAATLAHDLPGARSARRADDPLRRRHRGDPVRHAGCRRRRHRRRLAHATRRGVGRASATTAGSRATSIPRCCSARASGCSKARPT